MKIAVLNFDFTKVLEVKDVDSKWLDEIRASNNPKAQFIRDLIEVPKPTAPDTQRVEQDGWSIGLDGVRPVWVIIDDPTIKPRKDRETAIRQAVADLILIRDSSGPLTAAQLSNAVRAISKALVALIEELRP